MKKILYHNNTQKEALEYTSKLVDFGLSLIVYSALNELLNGHNMLRHSKFFTFRIKQRANEALRKRNLKISELKNAVLHKGFSETYWDSVIDACEDDVKNLRLAIKSVLDKADIEESELISQMEVTRILLESSVIHYKEIINGSTNKFLTKNLKEMRGLDLNKVFIEFNINGIFDEWDFVCDNVYKTVGAKIDLNISEVSTAFEKLAEKFAKGLYIDECLSVAKEEYPEFSNTEIKREE